jgi:hypothetical protein
MEFMSAGQITNHDCRVILDPDVCYIQDRHTSYLVGTGPRRRDSQCLWELDWLHLPSAASVSRVSSACAFWPPAICFASLRSFRVSFRSRVFRSLSVLSIGKASSTFISL